MTHFGNLEFIIFHLSKHFGVWISMERDPNSLWQTKHSTKPGGPMVDVLAACGRSSGSDVTGSGKIGGGDVTPTAKYKQ